MLRHFLLTRLLLHLDPSSKTQVSLLINPENKEQIVIKKDKYDPKRQLNELEFYKNIPYVWKNIDSFFHSNER